jgi:alanine-glyoxylate transaminase/serine-glyoxylate transaminase/serine-pyruvate transaminase
MAEPAPPHYGNEWLEIYHEILDSLKQVFVTQNDLYPVVGPGSASMDAAFGSLTRTGDKVLILRSGFFGQRMGVIAQAYGLDVRTIDVPMGQPIEPDAVRERLAAEPDIQAVGVVHLETSTGVLNPLQEIVAVVNEFQVLSIVDAVSSMGGIPLPVDEWGIDVCVSVVNKCLGCPPSLGPISVSQRAWEQMERKGGRAHGWYLNLRTWKDYSINWADWHPTPTTMPTNNIIGLQVSLRRILDVGLEAWYERFVQAAQTIRTRLGQLGFEMFGPPAYISPLISAVYGLPGMDVEDFRRYLLEEWQIMISGGLEELRGKIFRVGHIGEAATPQYVERFLSGLEAYLELQGVDVPPRE